MTTVAVKSHALRDSYTGIMRQSDCSLQNVAAYDDGECHCSIYSLVASFYE